MGILNNNIEDICSLSPMQEGMLFHNLISKDSSAYVIQNLFNVEYSLDSDLIQQALSLLSLKYSVLRTMFVYEKVKEVRQVVLKKRNIEYQYINLENDNNHGCEAKVSEIVKDDLKRGFNLQNDSLLRVKLIHVNENENKILFTIHHIIIDGWCNLILFNSFFNYYERLKNGESFNRIESEIIKQNSLSHNYSDYIRWITKQNKENAEKYWKSELEGYDNDCELKPLKTPVPTDKVIMRQQTEVSEEITNKLKKIAKTNDSTINVLTESIVGILLQKINNCNDVVFGKVVSGRNVPIDGIENMVGLFINTIPLRVCSTKNETLTELLRIQNKKEIESFKYEYYSLAEIQNMSSKGSDLIKILYVFQNYTSGLDKQGEKNGISQISSREETNYDILIGSAELEGKLKFAIEYNPNKFCEEEIKTVLGRLVSICEQVANNPNCRIEDIEAITEEEKLLILNNFNATEKEYEKNLTIVEMFEERVRQTPDKIAFVYEEKRITYAELNSNANILANKLRILGVKPDDFVAIIADKSIEIIEGIYGIIKSGGAYVPIDPGYPEDRIKYIIDDCKPKAILKFTTEQINVPCGIPLIDLSDKTVWKGASENLDHVNNPNDLIYCIYTSGTTGKPKGVLIEHSGINRLINNFKNDFELCNNDVILLFASVSFDASVASYLAVSILGVEVVLLEPSKASDPVAIKKVVEKNNINILQFPPQFATQYEMSDAKIVCTSGSEAIYDVVKEIVKYADFVNAYGPTETTVNATFLRIRKGAEVPDRITIGKPHSNVKIYILSGDKLCGVGVPGELCIAGDGIARGYLNRPKLTEEKFVKNPFGEGRMYRTGDLARWLHDGNIDFLGRIDEQVKIRGFRIELGEIESRIREIEDIRDCAAIAKADASGDKEIYAYYTSDREVSVSEIRDRLSKILPEYMVPSYMMQIESIPVTRNGKLDKSALPEIKAKATRGYIAPRNEIEEKICTIFTEILNVEKVGIKDSFFELGGHSLKATKLVNRIEAETGTRIVLKEVFKHPTVEQLALLAGADSEDYVPIPKAEEKEYYPMSSAQKRIYLIQQMDPEAVTYNMPGDLKLTGEVRPDDLRAAIQAMIDRHEILRTQFLMIDGEPVQKILEHVEADFEYISSNEQDEKLMIEFLKPFDLASGRLVRIKLVDKGEYHLILFDMHHIISDGMSMNIFETELMKLYNGATLEPLTHQFKDYSEWMRCRDLSNQAEYWKSQFEDEIPVLDMPTDFPRPQEQSYAGSSIEVTFDKELSSGIKSLVKKTGTTEYMVFLAVAMVTLSKYSRQEDIVIGSPISGRTHRDTEKMLGMFVNTLAMRGKPEQNKTFNSFLEEIKETCLKAYENQDYPFEELVEAVDVQRDMARNPIFDVMLVYQNNDNVNIELKNSIIEEGNSKSKVAKFDISFKFFEVNNNYKFILEYCADLFKEKTAERLSKHFELLLRSIIENVSQRIGMLDMLSDEDSILWEQYNNTNEAIPEDSLDNIVHKQCIKTPDKIAIIRDGESITYGELWEKAVKTAGYLHAKGFGKGDSIAISGERTIETIVNIVGILTAGCSYVPENPEYPEERNKYIYENSKCKMLLDSLSYEENNMASYESYCCESDPDSIAYTIYTSGSTGVPKGVVIKHFAAANTIQDINRKFNLNESSCIIGLSAYSFDLSVYDIFGALSTGAQLVIVKDQKDKDEINKILDNYKVTFWNSVPAIMSMYLLGGGKGNSTLKNVLMSGDWIPITLPGQIKSEFPNCEICSLGGATEGSIWSIYYPIKKIPDRMTSIPYGMPLANQQMLIMNRFGKLSPIGAIGEICIAGKGVAEGYANQPAKTAKSFVNYEKYGRVYHTGDVGRLHEEGYIEFLGRMDEQVKIRGFRIELGEIESRFREIAGISDCAVVVRNDKLGDKAIYAYFVSEKLMNLQAIREILSNKLPEYMVPSYMMQIDKIPVTRNGKLDKKSLPEIEVKATKEYIAPRNCIEEAICKAFCELLNVEAIGINDSFFELGGDSIKAIRTVSKLRNLGYTATVTDIMNGKTPEKIALRIKTNSKKLKFEQGEVTGKITSTPIICEFEKYNLVKPEHYNQARMINVDGIDNDIIHKAMEALVKHHDVLRAVYRNKILEILPISESKLCDFYEFDYSREENKFKAVEDKCTEIQGSIDLENGPLVKIAVFELGDTKQMMFCIHHLVVDGVSWRILCEDLKTAISQIIERQEVILPEKTSSFIEWSKKLHEYGESLSSEEIEYWNNAVHEAKEGRIVYNYSENDAGFSVIEFDEKVTEILLKKSCNVYGAKIDEIILAAIARAVGQITGQEKVSVMIEGHGREDIDETISVDRTVGWFTNIYLINLRFSKDNKESILDAKDKLRNIPGAGMGYGFVDHTYTPNIFFNYLGDYSEQGSNLTFQYNSGNSISELNKLSDAININFSVKNGKLNGIIASGTKQFGQKFIDNLTKKFRNAIIDLADYCEKAIDEEKIDITEKLDYQMIENSVDMPFISSFDYNYDSDFNKFVDRMIEKYSENFVNSQTNVNYSPISLQRGFFEPNSEDNCQVVLRVSSNISKQLIMNSLHKIIKNQSVLRSSCNTNLKNITEHDFFAGWYIPYIEEKDTNEHTVERLASINRKERNDKLFINNDWYSFVAVIKRLSGEHYVFLWINHGFWDEFSSVIFYDLFKKCLLPDSSIEKYSYSEFVHDVTSRKDDNSVNEIIDNYIEQNNNLKKVIHEKNDKLFTLSAEMNTCCSYIEYFIDDPIKAMCELIIEVNPLLQDLNYLPVGILYHGRKNLSDKMLGMKIVVLPAVYSTNKKEIIGGLRMLEAGKEVPSILYDYDVYTKIKESNSFNFVINYHGLYSEEYSGDVDRHSDVIKIFDIEKSCLDCFTFGDSIIKVELPVIDSDIENVKLKVDDIKKFMLKVEENQDGK